MSDENIQEVEQKTLEDLLRHVQGVHENCILLGRRLRDNGEAELGIKLISNGFKHDLSKFSGIEWRFLQTRPKKKRTKKDQQQIKIGIDQHTSTNPHHPEYWGNIHSMPDVYVAEMVCDWKARATEFGTSLIDWIHEDALKRFSFSKDDPVYQKIKKYTELLCNKPFEEIK